MMHFSVPKAEQLQESDGSYYQGYHVHINGVHHCTLRYRQLRHLHEQLRNLFSDLTIPEFPPKRLLPLNDRQTEERRLLLEKYLQSIALDQRISSSTFLHAFLRLAQNETHLPGCDDKKSVQIRIVLPGEEVISVGVTTTEDTAAVVKKVTNQIGLPESLSSYFGLFIQDANDFNQFCYVRRLLNYESPFLAVKLSGERASLVLRKSYWDPSFDDQLLKDAVGTKLLYNQFRDDYKHYWIQPDEQQIGPLTRLIEQNKQLEVVKMARQMRFYGGVFFLPCLTDFPAPGTPVSIYAMSKELIFCYADLTERSFRVTRMRSWRITTLIQEQSMERPKLELSFEYLMSKDRLQWITIDSCQVIFLSLCLQSMVEELLRKQQQQENGTFHQLADEVIDRLTFLDKNGVLLPISGSTSVSKPRVIAQSHAKKTAALKESIRVRFRSSGGSKCPAEEARIENHAFEDIRDEDL